MHTNIHKSNKAISYNADCWDTKNIKRSGCESNAVNTTLGVKCNKFISLEKSEKLTSMKLKYVLMIIMRNVWIVGLRNKQLYG